MRLQAISYRRFLAAAACAAWLLPAGVRAADRDKHPGFVDGSKFVELSGDSGTLVEVSLHGPLLKQVARAMGRKSPDLGSFLEGIVSIHAVVLENPPEGAEVNKRMNALASDLEDKRWERIARVRDGGEDVWVFVLHDPSDEVLSGLTVLVRGNNEMVFVNLAGRLDLELVGTLAGAANIPGLDQLTGDDWHQVLKEHHKRKVRKSDGGSTAPDKDQKEAPRDGRSEGSR